MTNKAMEKTNVPASIDNNPLVQEPICLFHNTSLRGHVENILNLLRKGEKSNPVYFPLRYQNQVKSMLCVCDEKNRQGLDGWIQNNEEVIQKNVLDVVKYEQYLDNEMKQPTLKQIEVLLNILGKKQLINFDSLSSSDLGSQALLRFLHRIFSGEFKLKAEAENQFKMQGNTLKRLRKLISFGVNKKKEAEFQLDLSGEAWPELPKSFTEEHDKAGSHGRLPCAMKTKDTQERYASDGSNILSNKSEKIVPTSKDKCVAKENSQQNTTNISDLVLTNKSALATATFSQPEKLEPEAEFSKQRNSETKAKHSNLLGVEASIDGEATSERGDVCLYHDRSWRSKLENLLNVMRCKNKSTTAIDNNDKSTTAIDNDISIPEKYVYRVNKLICICDTKNRSKWVQWLKKNEKIVKRKTLDHFYSNVRETPQIKTLRSFINELEKGNLLNRKVLNSSNPGALVFLVLLYKIICQDFSDMKLVPCPITAPVNNTARAKKIETDIKLVGFPHQYIPFLIGRHGCQIYLIEMPFQCKIRIYTVTESGDAKKVWAHISKFMKDEKNEASSESFEKIIEKLNSRAKEIIAKRTAHEKKLKVLTKVRGRIWAEHMRRQNTFLETNLMPSNANNIKYVNAENYNRKHKVEYKRNKKDPVLFGSRCLNCLGPYDKKASQSDACIYHPGFIEKKYEYVKCLRKNIEGKSLWSCCDKPCDKSHATFELHQSTGCKKGYHNWRPTGQDARGGKFVGRREKKNCQSD